MHSYTDVNDNTASQIAVVIQGYFYAKVGVQIGEESKLRPHGMGAETTEEVYLEISQWLIGSAVTKIIMRKPNENAGSK